MRSSQKVKRSADDGDSRQGDRAEGRCAILTLERPFRTGEPRVWCRDGPPLLCAIGKSAARPLRKERPGVDKQHGLTGCGRTKRSIVDAPAM